MRLINIIDLFPSRRITKISQDIIWEQLGSRTQKIYKDYYANYVERKSKENIFKKFLEFLFGPSDVFVEDLIDSYGKHNLE